MSSAAIQELERARDVAAAGGDEQALEAAEAALAEAKRQASRAEAAERGREALEEEARLAREAERQAEARKRAQALADERKALAALVDSGLEAAVKGMRALQANAIALGMELRQLGETRGFPVEAEEQLWRGFVHRLRGVFERHSLPTVPERKAGTTADLDAAALRAFGLEVK